MEILKHFEKWVKGIVIPDDTALIFNDTVVLMDGSDFIHNVMIKCRWNYSSQIQDSWYSFFCDGIKNVYIHCSFVWNRS